MNRAAMFLQDEPEERHIPRLALRGLARRKGYQLTYGHSHAAWGVQRRRGEPPRWFRTSEALHAFLERQPDAPRVRY